MSLFKQFSVDEKKEREGVLITYGANDDGTIPGFRVLRRTGTNQRYAKALERETAPHRRKIDLGILSIEESNKIFMRVFCLSVLTGWENVQDQNNQSIVYSFENAMLLFQKLPELYDDLVTQSGKVSLFREESIEADAKN